MGIRNILGIGTLMAIPSIVIIAGVILSHNTHVSSFDLKQTEYDYAPVVYKVYNKTFPSAVSLCQLYGGFGGVYRDPNGVVIRAIVPLEGFDCSTKKATYCVYLHTEAPFKLNCIDTYNNPNPGVNFGGELLWYKWLSFDVERTTRTAAVFTLHYYDYNNKIPYALLCIGMYSGRDTYTPTSPKAGCFTVNLSQLYGIVYNPPTDPSSMYIRTFVTPYTPTNPEIIGTFFNYPEMIILVGMIKDADGIKSTFYVQIPENTSATPVMSYANSIIIPIGMLYSQDKSSIYVFALTITKDSPNVIKVGWYQFDAVTGEFIGSNSAITSVTSPVNVYYPDIMVYYINIPEFVQSGASLVTSTPIKVALYSPTLQKIIVLDVDINATVVSATLYDVSIQASISSTIDISALTGGDYNKARLMAIDFQHPKYPVTGLLAYRQTVYDSDVFLNPFGVKAWLYNGQWYSYKFKEVIQKINYKYPKANVMPDYPVIYGMASPVLLDMQVYSNDGFTATGYDIYAFYLLPVQKYAVTPKKFTYEITYTYYVTPIAITYTPEDPSQPQNLTNVLVKVVIQNPYNIIATPDARDVRFFLTNTYGGDYFLYKGLDYAIESINLTQAVFYVLIPSISANQTLTIYMYSGFRYAQPVAKDYFSMIASYPVLVSK